MLARTSSTVLQRVSWRCMRASGGSREDACGWGSGRGMPPPPGPTAPAHAGGAACDRVCARVRRSLTEGFKEGEGYTYLTKDTPGLYKSIDSRKNSY